MRLLRVRLENFRGVEASEVEFAPVGVTVVAGPNEVGKSSIAAAFDLLLRYPDSSTHRDVVDVKPVDRDEPTRVEAEFTTGPYHLIYSKRWFARRGTELTVVAPRRESLTGREAHERVETILEETLDRALFGALWSVQGERVDQPRPGRSTSLVAALDRAAAGRSDPKAESSLREAIVAERSGYFTDTGRPTRARDAHNDRLAAAEARVADLKETVSGLVADGDALRTAEAERSVIESDRASNRPLLAGLEEQQRKIDVLSQSLAPLELEVERARAVTEAAVRACEEREDVRGALDAATRRHDELCAGHDGDTAQVAVAEAEDTARRLYEEARERHEVLVADAEVASADVEFRRAEFDSQTLSERHDRLVAARAKEEAALRFLETCTVDGSVRAEVDAAALDVSTASSSLKVASPPIDLEAHAAVQVSLNGEPRSLAAGDQLHDRVGNRLELTIDDRLTVVVGGGGGVAELEASLEEARIRLDRLVRRHGLDPADPRTSVSAIVEQRSRAERDIDEARTTRKNDLRDFASEEELVAKLDHARGEVSGYEGRRASALPLPVSLDAAQEERDRIGGLLSGAREASEAARRGWEAAREVAKDHVEKAAVRRALVDRAAEDAESARRSLEEARATVPDEELVAAESSARKVLEETEQRFTAAQADIRSRNPDEVALRLASARALDERCGQGLADLHEKMVRIEGRLSALDDQDVQAALETAERELDALSAQRAATERRAAAVALLYEVFERHRQAQMRAYVAPYRAELERLAQIVFGPGASVEVDPEDFSIVARTVDGVTVPFRSLSTGAAEQLGVLARLACAVVVNPGPGPGDGEVGGCDTGGRGWPVGVPVILDDALGNSDPERLRDLGVALDAVSESAQVIVMTSTPDRYRWVGGARVVKLGSRGVQIDRPV